MNLDASSFTPDDPRMGSTPPLEPLMSIREVCEWLGIGDTTLRKLRKPEKLVPLKIEGRILYEPSDVRMYLALRRDEAKNYPSSRARNSQNPGLK